MINNPFFPGLTLSNTADGYEWVLLCVSSCGFVLNTWLCRLSYRDNKLANDLIKSPRLRFVAYIHFRQSTLALAVQVVLLATAIVGVLLPSPVLLIGVAVPHAWMYQSIVRNIGMVLISVITVIKAWFNWTDQYYLLQFTQYDASLHEAIADVKQHAESAYHEANTVNLKLAKMSEHIDNVQQESYVATEKHSALLGTIADTTVQTEKDIHDVADVSKETLDCVKKLDKPK